MKKIIAAFLFTALFSNSNVFSQTIGDEDKEMFNKGKARDQKEIDDAINGWWTASMKNRDQRIQWWRNAKFGMFMHWGIYSLPGGEWKGKKVSGYAEHLMRKEKISRAEYLELAHKFNPVKFNAEEWVQNAKAAGMRYMIITSKHHDGFAMYPSDVSDFNIRKQTPFKRDPMAELSAACKKYGLKFGFYYSHAFDWEHPDAPGTESCATSFDRNAKFVLCQCQLREPIVAAVPAREITCHGQVESCNLADKGGQRTVFDRLWPQPAAFA